MYNYIKMPFKKCETLEHILFCKKKKKKNTFGKEELIKIN